MIDDGSAPVLTSDWGLDIAALNAVSRRDNKKVGRRFIAGPGV